MKEITIKTYGVAEVSEIPSVKAREEALLHFFARALTTKNRFHDIQRASKGDWTAEAEEIFQKDWKDLFELRYMADGRVITSEAMA